MGEKFLLVLIGILHITNCERNDPFGFRLNDKEIENSDLSGRVESNETQIDKNFSKRWPFFGESIRETNNPNSPDKVTGYSDNREVVSRRRNKYGQNGRIQVQNEIEVPGQIAEGFSEKSNTNSDYNKPYGQRRDNSRDADQILRERQLRYKWEDDQEIQSSTIEEENFNQYAEQRNENNFDSRFQLPLPVTTMEDQRNINNFNNEDNRAENNYGMRFSGQAVNAQEQSLLNIFNRENKMNQNRVVPIPIMNQDEQSNTMYNEDRRLQVQVPVINVDQRNLNNYENQRNDNNYDVGLASSAVNPEEQNYFNTFNKDDKRYQNNYSMRLPVQENQRNTNNFNEGMLRSMHSRYQINSEMNCDSGFRGGYMRPDYYTPEKGLVINFNNHCARPKPYHNQQLMYTPSPYINGPMEGPSYRMAGSPLISSNQMTAPLYCF